MLEQNEVKSWVLVCVSELLSQVADDGLGSTFDGDLHDDVGFGGGRLASFEIVNGKLKSWAWRSADACGRADCDYPLKLRLSWGDGENRTAWLRQRSWEFDRGDRRHRVVQV
jgi:hypothetical protein